MPHANRLPVYVTVSTRLPPSKVMIPLPVLSFGQENFSPVISWEKFFLSHRLALTTLAKIKHNSSLLALCCWHCPIRSSTARCSQLQMRCVNKDAHQSSPSRHSCPVTALSHRAWMWPKASVAAKHLGQPLLIKQ